MTSCEPCSSKRLRILLLNQTFHPDLVATAYYSSQLAKELAGRGHAVDVVTGRRAYDDPTRLYESHEEWEGVNIHRLTGTGLGKSRKWRRVVDFASVGLKTLARAFFLPRADVVIALTSPPLISVLAAIVCALRGGRFVYWVMDLNPDAAISAGWLRNGSWVGRVLEWLSRFSFGRSSDIIVLDEYMAQRVLDKGVSEAKLHVIPPWLNEDHVRFDKTGREEFRKRHGLDEKFVAMYSGNHSPCHPLCDVLQAAGQMREQCPEVVFVFVGGGSEYRRMRQEASEKGLSNVLFLPYQEWDQLSGSLSAADLHIVAMGQPFVGIVHPCKLYNVLSVNAPVLLVAPAVCHLVNVMKETAEPGMWARVDHGDGAAVMNAVLQFKEMGKRPDGQSYAKAIQARSADMLLPEIVNIVENVAGAEGAIS